MAGARRLSAVMFTDLVEFTSLSQRDEAKMLGVLDEHRALVRPLLARFGGREVKTTGDGFLVEFDSALNATLCAAEIQRSSQRWRQEAGGDRPYVRIGIHVGDVVHQLNDILGDAVNIASRIEPLADPGGICVTGAVFEQVLNKVPHKFERLPTPALKGVHTPVEVYRLVRAGAELGPAHRASPANRVAVLPLSSIGPDARDEYLADGFTDEIINALSRLSGLRVIARSSVDHYRGRAVPLPQVARELNVGSVLEGSVRRAGNQVRVTIQLIDAPTQAHLWARQYDRALDDVFAIQSDIALHVAENLRITVAEREATQLKRRPTVGPASNLAYLRGTSLLRVLSLDNVRRARVQFEEAIALDPKNARAYAGIAYAVYREALLSGAPVPDVFRALATAKEWIAKSLAIDPDAAESHTSLAHVHDELFEFAPAEQELVRALELNPALATAHRLYARLLVEKGRLGEALEELRIAEEADPMSSEIQSVLARILLALGRPEEAAAKIHRVGELEPDGMRLRYVRLQAALASDDRPALKREVDWFSDHDPNGTPEARSAYWRGVYAAATGDRADALRSIETLSQAREPATDLPYGWANEQIAEIYGRLGDADACFPRLQAALPARLIAFEVWRLTPGLDAIRADPRFNALIARAGLA